MTELKNDNNFKNIIRDKFEKLEYPYDNKDWQRLEKDLHSAGISKQPGSIRKLGYYAGGIFILIVSSLIYMNLQQQEGDQEIVPNQDNITITELQNPEISKEINTSEAKINDLNIATKENKQAKANSIGIEGNNIKVLAVEENNPIPNEKPEDKISIEVPQLVNVHNTNTKDPDAQFYTTKIKGCAPVEISFIPIEISDSIDYLWDFGDGEFSDENNPVHIYSEEGNYIVSLNIKYPVSNKTAFYCLTDEIIVFPVPNSRIISNSNNNSYNFKLEEYTDNIIKWQLNEQLLSDDIESNYTFTQPGVYLLSCTVENEYFCINESSELLEIKIVHDIPMPNAFSPNGDGNNDLFGPTREFYEKYKLDFKIYRKSGELVFSGNSSHQKWDGLIMGSGRQAEVEVYVYILHSTDKYNNTCVKNGHVTLYN